MSEGFYVQLYVCGNHGNASFGKSDIACIGDSEVVKRLFGDYGFSWHLFLLQLQLFR